MRSAAPSPYRSNERAFCRRHSPPSRQGRGAAPHKDGVTRAKAEFHYLLRVDNDVWDGDRLSFAASALGQRAHGFIDVYDGAVRLELMLPWLLARFAHAVRRVVGQRGQLLLEKK